MRSRERNIDLRCERMRGKRGKASSRKGGERKLCCLSRNGGEKKRSGRRGEMFWQRIVEFNSVPSEPSEMRQPGCLIRGKREFHWNKS